MLSTDCCDDECNYIAIAVPGIQGPRGLPGDGAAIYNEVPAGVQDGVNAYFTLASIPLPGSVAIYRNGLREILGTSFTLTGAVIQFSTAPLADDILTADYVIGS